MTNLNHFSCISRSTQDLVIAKYVGFERNGLSLRSM